MEHDLATISAAWERYVAGPEPVPDAVEGVRPEILASWRRVKGKSDPFAAGPPTLSRQAFEIVRDENEWLCQIARPYLSGLARALRGTGHSVTLADRRGFQLLLSADRDRPDPADDGRDFSETAAGTNAIGTALATGGPITVRGPEHFLRAHHDRVCCAVPLRDTVHGVVGCLNVTGPLATDRPDVMDLLALAATGIEHELALTQTNALRETVLDSSEDAILLLDADGIVRYHNAQVPSLLRLRDEALLGRPLSAVLDHAACPAELRRLDRPVEDLECTLLNAQQEPIDVSLTLRPVRRGAHGPSAAVVILRTQRAVHHMANRIAGFRARYTFDAITGGSGVLQMVKALGQIAAEAPTPVLLFGENGTGKEMLAQAIHNASDRADGPFVSVDCGAVPKGLLASELFGYEGGAFSGAKEGGHPGKFELADGGTLFLDAIDALSLDLQASLLAVLQTRSITRLGGQRAKPVDVKLLASTSASLLGAVQDRTFRDDLYYRLNALNITIPPLRERTEDVLPLVRLFLGQYRKGEPPLTFDEEAMAALLHYDWPGNVRELENAIERAANLAAGPVAHLGDLPSNVVDHYYAGQRGQGASTQASTPPPQSTAAGPALPPLERQTYDQILSTLKRERGNVKATAAALGIPLSTLYRKLNKYGLDPKLLRQSARER